MLVLIQVSAALNTVVVAMHKCEHPKENCWFDLWYKLCCYKLLSYVRLKEHMLNPLTHLYIQVTGEELSSWLPKFLGL